MRIATAALRASFIAALGASFTAALRALFRWLMQNARNGQRERRNVGVERMAVRRNHLVRAMHRSDRCLQTGAARVLEALAGLQERLLADDARPFHLLHLMLGVGDDPVAADELRGDL